MGFSHLEGTQYKITRRRLLFGNYLRMGKTKLKWVDYQDKYHIPYINCPI